MKARGRHPLQQRWEAADAALARAEGAFLVTLLAVMVGVGFLQVVLRNFFHTGLFAADLLLRQALIWLGLLGASLATRGEGRHIEIDILSRAIPPPWSGRLRRLADLFAAVVCALLARASFLFVATEWKAASRVAAFFPAWALQIILPLGFALIALRFLGAAIFGRPPKPTAENASGEGAA